MSAKDIYKINATKDKTLWSHQAFAYKETNPKIYIFLLPFSENVNEIDPKNYLSFKKEMRQLKTILKCGYSNVMRTDVAKEKIKQTNIEKYGYENPFQNENVKEKIKNTNIEKYGVENPQQNELIKQKTFDTNIEKYGSKCTLNSSVVSAKKLETWNAKYDGLHPCQHETVKEKRILNNLQKHGVSSTTQLESVKEKIANTRHDNIYGMSRNEMKSLWREEFLKNGFRSAMEKYKNVGYLTAIRFFIKEEEKIKGKSIAETDIQKILLNETQINFTQSNYNIVPNNNRLEIDLLNREHKLSIEFNGVYWHQIHTDKLKDDLSKAEEMREIDYKHFALDETDMNKLPLLSKMLNPNKTRLYARKLELKAIKNPKDFLNENHLQGSVSAKVAYGLFLDNELIQTMTFGKSRFDKSIEWEIIRLCTKPNHIVIGGTERLFKAFEREHNPKSIVSYSDNKYFDGKVYGKLGLNFVGNTPSNYVWWKNDISLKRYQTMKHKLPVLLGDKFDSELTERENMLNCGWVQLKDLGNKKWVKIYN